MTSTNNTAGNRRLAKKRVQCLNEVLCFVSSSVLADSLVLRNPLLRQAPKRCTQYIFRTYADVSLIGFTHHIYRKLLPKRKATNLKKMEKNCTENLQRQFSEISNLMTILSRKLIIIDNIKPKNCVKNQILPKIGIQKLDKVVKSEN